MNFVAARRIITVHQYRGVGQLAKIPRSPRMIEDHLLIKLFDFRAHDRARTGDPPPWRKETHRSVKDFNHSIDLLHRVVEVEARARCAGHTEPTHQRLVAMMSAAHRQPVLIRERGEIVRMRSVHDEPNQRTALFLWPKDARARQFADALSRVSRKLRIVFENRRRARCSRCNQSLPRARSRRQCSACQLRTGEAVS